MTTNPDLEMTQKLVGSSTYSQNSVAAEVVVVLLFQSLVSFWPEKQNSERKILSVNRGSTDVKFMKIAEGSVLPEFQ